MATPAPIPTPQIEKDANAAMDALLDNLSQRLFYKNQRGVDLRIYSDGKINETPLTKGVLEMHINTYPPKDTTWSKDRVKEVAAYASHNYDFSKLPSLDGGTHIMPFMRADYTLVDEQGYDSVTRSMYVPAERFKAYKVKSKPSPKDAKAAYEKLRYPLGDFPFSDEASKQNAVAFVLTSLSRSAVDDVCPALCIDAAAQSSGKTLLSDVLSWMTQGIGMTPISNKNMREVEKNIDSDLLSHKSFICVDNIKEPLESERIATILTDMEPAIRKFGNNEQRFKGMKNANFIFNGNRLDVDSDIRKRVYWVKLWHENPASRDTTKFTIRDMKSHMREHWLEYHEAAMTIIQAWRTAGRPLRNVAGSVLDKYSKWESNVGGMMAFVGANDFLKGHKEISEQADHELQTIVDFFKLVYDTFPESRYSDTAKGVSKSAVVEMLAGDWKGTLPGVKGTTPLQLKQSFGKWIAKRFDLNFGGYMAHERRTMTDRNFTIEVIKGKGKGN